MKNLWLCLSLLAVSFMAYADGGVQYGLISNMPYTSGFNVTKGYINYYFIGTTGSLPGNCPDSGKPGTVDLTSIAHLPLLVNSNLASRFTLPQDPALKSCFTAGGIEYVNLYITQVDYYGSDVAIDKKDGTCQLTRGLANYDDHEYANMMIQVTKDNFYCSMWG